MNADDDDDDAQSCKSDSSNRTVAFNDPNEQVEIISISDDSSDEIYPTFINNNNYINTYPEIKQEKCEEKIGKHIRSEIRQYREYIDKTVLHKTYIMSPDYGEMNGKRGKKLNSNSSHHNNYNDNKSNNFYQRIDETSNLSPARATIISAKGSNDSGKNQNNRRYSDDNEFERVLNSVNKYQNKIVINIKNKTFKGSHENKIKNDSISSLDKNHKEKFANNGGTNQQFATEIPKSISNSEESSAEKSTKKRLENIESSRDSLGNIKRRESVSLEKNQNQNYSKDNYVKDSANKCRVENGISKKPSNHENDKNQSKRHESSASEKEYSHKNNHKKVSTIERRNKELFGEIISETFDSNHDSSSSSSNKHRESISSDKRSAKSLSDKRRESVSSDTSSRHVNKSYNGSGRSSNDKRRESITSNKSSSHDSSKQGSVQSASEKRRESDSSDVNSRHVNNSKNRSHKYSQDIRRKGHTSETSKKRSTKEFKTNESSPKVPRKSNLEEKITDQNVDKMDSSCNKRQEIDHINETTNRNRDKKGKNAKKSDIRHRESVISGEIGNNHERSKTSLKTVGSKSENDYSRKVESPRRDSTHKDNCPQPKSCVSPLAEKRSFTSDSSDVGAPKRQKTDAVNFGVTAIEIIENVTEMNLNMPDLSSSEVKENIKKENYPDFHIMSIIPYPLNSLGEGVCVKIGSSICQNKTMSNETMPMNQNNVDHNFDKFQQIFPDCLGNSLITEQSRSPNLIPSTNELINILATDQKEDIITVADVKEIIQKEISCQTEQYLLDDIIMEKRKEIQNKMISIDCQTNLTEDICTVCKKLRSNCDCVDPRLIGTIKVRDPTSMGVLIPPQMKWINDFLNLKDTIDIIEGLNYWNHLQKKWKQHNDNLIRFKYSNHFSDIEYNSIIWRREMTEKHLLSIRQKLCQKIIQADTEMRSNIFSSMFEKLKCLCKERNIPLYNVDDKYIEAFILNSPVRNPNIPIMMNYPTSHYCMTGNNQPIIPSHQNNQAINQLQNANIQPNISKPSINVNTTAAWHSLKPFSQDPQNGIRYSVSPTTQSSSSTSIQLQQQEPLSSSGIRMNSLSLQKYPYQLQRHHPPPQHQAPNTVVRLISTTNGPYQQSGSGNLYQRNSILCPAIPLSHTHHQQQYTNGVAIQSSLPGMETRPEYVNYTNLPLNSSLTTPITSVSSSLPIQAQTARSLINKNPSTLIQTTCYNSTGHTKNLTPTTNIFPTPYVQESATSIVNGNSDTLKNAAVVETNKSNNILNQNQILNLSHKSRDLGIKVISSVILNHSTEASNPNQEANTEEVTSSTVPVTSDSHRSDDNTVTAGQSSPANQSNENQSPERVTSSEERRPLSVINEEELNKIVRNNFKDMLLSNKFETLVKENIHEILKQGDSAENNFQKIKTKFQCVICHGRCKFFCLDCYSASYCSEECQMAHKDKHAEDCP